MIPILGGQKMDMKVLGALRVRDLNFNYSPTAPKPKQLLALLMIHAGRSVSVTNCVRELWPESPPKSAVATIHTYIMQIRKCMSKMPSVGAPRELLATLDRSYRLDVPPHTVDLYRFREWTTHGRLALGSDNDLMLAMECFEAALAEWEGDMLSDVRTGPLLDAQVARACEERITVLEQWVAAKLRLGLHHELIHELTELVHRHAANENLVAQYMVALYRSGRQADALAAYQRLRHTLNDELGIVPSERLRNLYQAILNQSPELQDSAWLDVPEAPARHGRQMPTVVA